MRSPRVVHVARLSAAQSGLHTRSGGCMTQYTKRKFFAALKVAVLNLSLPLLLSSNSWAQASIYAQIPPLNQKLKQANKRNHCWRASEPLFNVGTSDERETVKTIGETRVP